MTRPVAVRQRKEDCQGRSGFRDQRIPGFIRQQDVPGGGRQLEAAQALHADFLQPQAPPGRIRARGVPRLRMQPLAPRRAAENGCRREMNHGERGDIAAGFAAFVSEGDLR